MATFEQLQQAAEEYHRFAEQFNAFVDRLMANADGADTLHLTWGERTNNTVRFSFLDIQARLRFVLTRFEGEQMGKMGVERLKDDGSVDKVVSLVFFDEIGYVYLVEPMKNGLLFNEAEGFQPIVAHLLSPFVHL